MLIASRLRHLCLNRLMTSPRPCQMTLLTIAYDMKLVNPIATLLDRIIASG